LTLGWCVVPVGPDQFDVTPDYAVGKAKSYGFAMIPPNKGFMGIEDALPLGEDEKIGMGLKAMRLCVHGRIEYRGALKRKKAKPYETTFCYFHQLGTNAFWLHGPYNRAT
jgi:hypothetical protein